VERWLAFIDERRFGVSMSQASADIARYLALEPRGVTYEKSAKRYVAAEDFRPAVAPADAERSFAELRLVDLGILPLADTLLGTTPPFDATPVPERPVDLVVLRAVVRAIRERRALSALYQSMSRPEPVRRILEPHALGHDGFRWHARAFDPDSGQFRDFVLGRLTRARDRARSPMTTELPEGRRASTCAGRSCSTR
jgi:hypothetical protein